MVVRGFRRGHRRVAEAVNRVKVEVAQQDRDGAMGQATANRRTSPWPSMSLRPYTVGRRPSSKQRIQVAAAEAGAVDVENKANAEIAESNAKLAEIRA